MRKTLMIMIVMFVLASPVMAGDYAVASGEKFSRGLANTTTGWVELPVNIVRESRQHHVAAGLTYGTLKGVAHSIGRTAVGVFDLVTFPVPSGAIVHPDYVWSDGSHETRYDL